jgi:hypothetical protein
VSVALNAATAVELAGFCPFVSNVFAIDRVLDDFRRRQDYQLELFPGLRGSR